MNEIVTSGMLGGTNRIFNVQGSNAGITMIQTRRNITERISQAEDCAQFTFLSEVEARNAFALLAAAGILCERQTTQYPNILALKYPSQIKTAMRVMEPNLDPKQIDEQLKSALVEVSLSQKYRDSWNGENGLFSFESGNVLLGNIGCDLFADVGDGRMGCRMKLDFIPADSLVFSDKDVGAIKVDESERTGSRSYYFKDMPSLVRALLIFGCGDAQVEAVEAKKELRELAIKAQGELLEQKIVILENGDPLDKLVAYVLRALPKGISLNDIYGKVQGVLDEARNGAEKAATQEVAQEALGKVGDAQEQGQGASSPSPSR